MKIKELISKLTEHYAWCIENLPEEDFFSFSRENFVGDGICWCAECKFRIDISCTRFISVFIGNDKDLFLCPIINSHSTFEEALESLRTRHKRLLEMADYESEEEFLK